ncbi:MAG: hydantoinase/oxoprolinase family protein [bacterium]|nr:hydantoinase/oxoprolinase family protein [bacterium]
MAVRMGIDIGGTFTDLALFDEESGQVRVTKAASTPGEPHRAVNDVIGRAGIDNSTIRDLVHGTTVATNALLERKHRLPGLITTQGFSDMVFIQRMNRKHHYDLQWDKPIPFAERRHCLEVDERCNYKGEIIEPLDEEGAREAARRLRDEGLSDIAVCFLFSYVNPANELRMREIIAEECPGARVSLSHEVYPRWREYDRMSTTLADAFLKTLVGEYIEDVASGLAPIGVDANFLMMKSNGGLVDHRAASAKPVDLLVSGPVGGVLSALYFGSLVGRQNLISMDMGGTSFDVSLIEGGQANRTAEFEIEWGLPVYAPMVDVRTIGAGGGSVAWIDKGGLLRVGPRSAGADPGPACYRRGGTEATVTDANVALGRINPDSFFGGEMQLDAAAARAALGRLGDELDMTPEDVATAVVDLVDFNMVNAIRLVSIDRGLDPRDFTLVSFGGACSLHANALARIIGARDVLVPVYQGVFSAFGLMTADMRVDESVTTSFRSDLVDFDRATELVRRLRDTALQRIAREGYAGTPVLEPTVEMRYSGQNYGTSVVLSLSDWAFGPENLAETIDRFESEHRRLYGYDIPGEIVELVLFTMTAVGVNENPGLAPLPPGGSAAPIDERPVYFSEAGWVPTRIYRREQLPPGAELVGPAVIEEAMSTTLVHPGERVDVDDYGNLLIHVAPT